jgi:hypothetical protein
MEMGEERRRESSAASRGAELGRGRGDVPLLLGAQQRQRRGSSRRRRRRRSSLRGETAVEMWVRWVGRVNASSTSSSGGRKRSRSRWRELKRLLGDVATPVVARSSSSGSSSSTLRLRQS